VRPATLLVLAMLSAACGGGGGASAPVVIPPLTVSTSTVQDGVNGAAYNQTLTATGGTPPYTWSLASGSGPLPNGLMLSSSGVVSGTPTETGTFNFNVQVQDSAGRTATRALSIRIGDPLAITTDTLPATVVNNAYNQSLSASGGIGALSWSISAGALPPGLTLNSSSGVISGTATAAGAFSFTARVADSSSPQQTATRAVEILVATQLTIATPSALPFAVITQPYTEILEAVGGTPPYSWSIPTGLPPGLVLDSVTGEISGVPTEENFFTFEVSVSDASTPPQSSAGSFDLTVRGLPAFVTMNFPDGAQGVAYTRAIFLSGGRDPYTLQLIAGGLPDGLELTPPTPAISFDLTGVPNELGEFGFTLELTDSSSPPLTATGDFTLRINEQLVITTVDLPEGFEGMPYSATLTATGGVPPYSWQIFGAPSELSLNSSTGEIGGTPTTAFNGPVDVQVNDSGDFPQVKHGTLTLRIVGLLSIATTSLEEGVVDKPYDTSLSANGGTPPFTWSLMAGSLPSGLSLDSSTGQIGGLPDTEETASFTVHVDDSGTTFPQSATQDLSIAIGPRLGRNDSVATATLLSNGQHLASISPYADPASAPAGNPDQDFYQLSANAGATVRVEIFAQRLVPLSELDSVMEIVDVNGIRFTTCRPAGTAGSFNQPCLNDDLTALGTLDSGLEFQVPGAGVVTFFVRVLDFRGDARPDSHYRIDITGAN